MFQPPGSCPACGDDVPPRALACPSCGADDRSGWRDEETMYDEVDLGDDFDYEGFVREEFGSSSAGPRPRHVSPGWWLVAIVLLVCFLLGVLGLGTLLR